MKGFDIMNQKRIQWSTSTDPDLHKCLKQLAETSRIPISRLMDEAIEDLLLKHKIITQKTKTP